MSTTNVDRGGSATLASPPSSPPAFYRATPNSKAVALDDHPLREEAPDQSDEDSDEGNLVVMSSREDERLPVNGSGPEVSDYSSAAHRLSKARSLANASAGESRSWTPGTMKEYGHARNDRGLHASGSKDGDPPPSPLRPSFLAQNPRGMRLASQASLGTGTEGRPGSIYDDNIPHWRATAQGSTPLERTIDAIGMGRYQYAVLVLSGLGWAADNMWLQGVAICLPRIQDEWHIADRWIGLVSSCTFAGMMIGALAWGSYADTFGRKNAFNLTLLITAVFGLLSSFAPNFLSLCLCLFLLGTGVGGSMPTDGTIFLEALPKRSHYLLTALSVFFAAGSVLTSVLAFIIVPSRSCGGAQPCPSEDNKGWRYLLASLGCLTVLFVIARLVFFTLFESPKFLVSAGKHDEARVVLQRIAEFNGQPKRVRLADVSDRQERQRNAAAAAAAAEVGAQPQARSHSTFVGTSKQAGEDMRSSFEHMPNAHCDVVDNEGRVDNDSEGEEERQGLLSSSQDSQYNRRHSFGGHEHQHNAGWTARAAASGKPFVWPAHLQWVPTAWRASLEEGSSRYAELFTPYWRKTTVLVWLIWTVFTLAYTMVNVFLPKYLETRTGTPAPSSPPPPSDSTTRRNAMEAVMREFLFYSLASLPGSLLGAYLIETRLGRIRSMALSTLFLAFSLLAFASSASPVLVVLSSCSISLFASIAYAVIYSYSPEVFKTSLRGTASGTASALSRFAGILAPVVAGALLQISVNLPLYLGFALFAVTVGLQLSLPYETRGRDVEAESPDAAAGAPTSVA